MKLIMLNPQKLNLSNFCQWLLPRIQKELLDQIDPVKCAKRDATINDLNIIQYVGTERKVSTETMLKQAILNLKWKKLPDWTYELAIDKRPVLYGSTTTIDTIARLIEYGTEEITPLPIFRKVFKSFEDDLQGWYNLFEAEENGGFV